MNEKKAKQIRKYIKQEYNNGERPISGYVSTKFTKFYINDAKIPVQYEVVTTRLVPQCLRSIYKNYKKRFSM